MKLIKLTDDHYIVVDDSEIKEDCYALHEGPLGEREIVTANGQCKLDKKITHSTQPLECDKMWTPVNGKQWMCNTMLCCGKILNPKTKPISLQEVKELIGEVDVEKKAFEYTSASQAHRRGFIDGYNQAFKDNKEKKYTEKDIDKAISWAINSGRTGKVTITDIDNFIQSLQPKTEWEVEFIDGKLKLK